MTELLFNLDEELLTARAYIERAEAMLAEITEEYFSTEENNTHTPQGESNIICGFRQNRIVAEIARDYAMQVRQTLDAMADMIQHTPAKGLTGEVCIGDHRYRMHIEGLEVASREGVKGA